MRRLSVSAIIASRDFGCIFTGISEAGERIRVRTYDPVWPAVGEVYDVEGTGTTFRDRWGRDHQQVDRARLTRVRTSGRLLGPWLQNLPGVGEIRAQRLMAAYGHDLLEVLDDPARVQDIAGALEPNRAALAFRLATRVQTAFRDYAERERDGISESSFYQRLEEMSVEDRAAARSLWRLLGNDAWARLARRPYCAASVLPWRQADHLGIRLLSAAENSREVDLHPDRLAGAVDSVVRDILTAGHTAATQDEVLRRLQRKGVPGRRALEIGLERRRILSGSEFLHAPGAAYLERDLYAQIERLRSSAPRWTLARDDEISRAVIAAEHETGLALTGEQRMAVGVLLQQPVGLLQGGAGTGKTTSMRVLVAAWERLGGHVEATALAGKAALKLRQSTGIDVLTIAQVLKRLDERERLEAEGKLEPDQDGEEHEDGSLKKRLPRFVKETLLLVDEASMADLPSLRQLARKLPDGARMLLVGDVAQLPPVGLGQVYHDLVHAGPGLFELTRILRQAEDNPLLDVAAAIRAGQEPHLPPYEGASIGVHFRQCGIEAVPEVMGMIRRELSHADGDILALAARQTTVKAVCRGEMHRRQEEGASGVRVGPLCPWVAVGDPVIMTTNHYKFGLANGQLGQVTSIDPLSVAWDGEDRSWEVVDEYAVDIASAWAITCHKSQGSDAARVVIGLDSKAMLTRPWLYTAVTRARHQAVLVGPKDLLAEAVGRLGDRTTGFSILTRAKRPATAAVPLPLPARRLHAVQ
jgi:exodeoxyribonuclease V alpha subunit